MLPSHNGGTPCPSSSEGSGTNCVRWRHRPNNALGRESPWASPRPPGGGPLSLPPPFSLLSVRTTATPSTPSSSSGPVIAWSRSLPAPLSPLSSYPSLQAYFRICRHPEELLKGHPCLACHPHLSADFRLEFLP